MKKLLIAVLGVFFVGHACAGLLVEPVVGWTYGQEIDFPGGKNYTSGGQGRSYGGRLGYQNFGFQVGADYLNSSVDMDDNDFKDDLNTKEWAAFIGYELPLFFRLYAGYILGGSGDTNVNNVTVKLEDPTGYKLGLGFTLLPIIDVNLEYRNATFDQVKASIFSANREVDYKTYMISISAPFNLF